MGPATDTMLDNSANARPVVLVVEDEALLRIYAADLLEEAGFEVVEAASAEAALELMARRPHIRVLFTDIQLPGALDGLELAHKVHEEWPHVRFLVTSGGREPSLIPGRGHFLPKPYTRDEVVREINNFQQEERAGRRDANGRRSRD